MTDPWEIVYDHKRYNCTKYRKEKTVKESVIYGSKYNSKSCKVCKIFNDYRRGEKDEKHKRGEFKDEWCQNGHLIRRKTDHVFSPAEIVCTSVKKP